MSRKHQHWMMSFLPPLLLLAVTVAGWQMIVWMLDMKPFVLPPPGAVARAAVRESGNLVSAFWLTGKAAGLGLIISILLGTAIAIVFSQSQLIRRSFYPYAIALQTVPIVAIAPLIVIWFEEGFHSVVLVTVIISLFPVITSVTTGLTSIDQGLVDLFRLQRAGRWQQLIKLRLPSAIPSLVTGARTAAGLAVVGAIVGEFFVSHSLTHRGLGYYIEFSVPNLKVDLLICCILCATLLGVLMFLLVSFSGRVLLRRWTADMEQQG